MHLKSRNKVSTVKWQGKKNNRRRSEINTGKTSERNGWGAFFPFLLFVLICRNRETVHSLLREGGNSFKFFFFLFFFFQSAVLCVLEILLLILIVSLSSSSPSLHHHHLLLLLLLLRYFHLFIFSWLFIFFLIKNLLQHDL